MSNHPIEALLRPPVELWSMSAAFAAGVIAFLAPWALMMPPGVATMAGASLFIFGGIRAKQAWQVLRYQRNMRRLPGYRLRADQVPVSQHKLFLGKGFRWTQQHTQRLRDTLKKCNAMYSQGLSTIGQDKRKSLMEKLTTGNIAALISPDYQDEEDHRPIFEWMDVIRRKGIVYVGLDALTDTTVASAVGNSMFADLVSVAGHIYKHGVAPVSSDTNLKQDPQHKPPQADERSVPTISLHADEFNELIGDEFVPLLNKAGGAGLDVRRPWRTSFGRSACVLFLSRRNGQVTAYTQTWSDVEARIGDKAKAGQVAGNFNTMIMLRVKELATAEMLTEQLPRVDVFTLMSVSGVDDSSDPGSGVDFKSRNEDRISVSEVPMLTAADMVSLPKGQALALLEGGHLWKIRMPLPDSRGDAAMPAAFTEITEVMQRTYITNDHWYRVRESWWQSGGDGSSLDESPSDSTAIHNG